MPSSVEMVFQPGRNISTAPLPPLSQISIRRRRITSIGTSFSSIFDNDSSTLRGYLALFSSFASAPPNPCSPLGVVALTLSIFEGWRGFFSFADRLEGADDGAYLSRWMISSRKKAEINIDSSKWEKNRQAKG